MLAPVSFNSGVGTAFWSSALTRMGNILGPSIHNPNPPNDHLFALFTSQPPRPLRRTSSSPFAAIVTCSTAVNMSSSERSSPMQSTKSGELLAPSLSLRSESSMSSLQQAAQGCRAVSRPRLVASTRDTCAIDEYGTILCSFRLCSHKDSGAVRSCA